jgi:hypothetical protein
LRVQNKKTSDIQGGDVRIDFNVAALVFHGGF